MSKKKRKHMPRQAGTTASEKPVRNPDGVVTGANYPTEEIKWWREAVEGLVVAIVLALLIRGFEAEAFVIPTGSMAPTLRGRHKDVQCEFCKFEYAAGASLDHELQNGRVVMTSCPMCANPQEIDYDQARDASFTGDRILVNKFSYDVLGEPERFDVIVFKNPNDAKQNYIKRLCGLPGESIRLFRGDIYARPVETQEPWQVCRKPPRKIRAMLQPVHDTKYVATLVAEKGLPPRWQAQPNANAWSTPDNGQTFDVTPSPETNWIRYRHVVPDLVEWTALKSGQKPMFQGARGELITDIYAYNSYLNDNTQATGIDQNGNTVPLRDRTQFWDRSAGKNWVGDLAVECDVQIQSDTGEFELGLVEGGWHFSCKFDVAKGQATLSVKDPTGVVRPMDVGPSASSTTAVKGTGTYRMMFSNVDSELRLWVNDELIDFGGGTTYERSVEEEETLRPFYGGEENPGDLAPVGVGGKNIKAHVDRLRIHRDKYYVAVKGHQDPTTGDYTGGGVGFDTARKIFRSPETWSTTELFNRMREKTFDLHDFADDSKDQFFPMGDNSPQSHDGRLWSNGNGNYVERQFLIGEAVLIYYPHPWHAKLPGEKFRTLPLIVYPKFSRMGLIR